MENKEEVLEEIESKSAEIKIMEKEPDSSEPPIQELTGTKEEIKAQFQEKIKELFEKLEASSAIDSGLTIEGEGLTSIDDDKTNLNNEINAQTTVQKEKSEKPISTSEPPKAASWYDPLIFVSEN